MHAVLLLAVSIALPSDHLGLLQRNKQAEGWAHCPHQCTAIEVRLHIKEPTFEVKGHYRANQAGFMRIDIYALDGNRVFTEALGPEGGWQWLGDGTVKTMSEDGEAALLHGVELPGKFHSLADLHAEGLIVESADESFAERNAVRYRVRLNDGFEKDYWLAKDSGRILGARDFRAFHPDVDATKETIESRYSNWQSVAGRVMALSEETVNPDTGAWLSSIELESVTYRAVWPVEVFIQP